MTRQKAIIIFISVVVLSIVAGFFVSPYSWGDKYQPWRLGLDLVGGAQLIYEVDMSNIASGDEKSVMDGLRDVIERRVNLFGVAEPNVAIVTSGESRRLLVELAGVKDVGEAIRTIGETPFLYFAEIGTGPVPVELEGAGEVTQIFPTELTGRYVLGAQLEFDQISSRPTIGIRFDSEGARLFEEITGRMIGRPLAIILDEEILSAPVVQERIVGGQAQITGQFTLEEARTLVARFNAGALPAPITLINQQTVGASLGTQSLDRIIFAGLIGTALVILFMLVYYRLLGIAASVALVMYIVLTLAVFKFFGMTMTLAGIAGFILSIGMAVDANILIFERRKEELAHGASPIAAITDGFKRAWPSIRDSNITTIITSVILYYAATGFVQGFALALGLGVLMSMFSAITITQAMVRSFIRT